jgi:hypothetical protein
LELAGSLIMGTFENLELAVLYKLKELHNTCLKFVIMQAIDECKNYVCHTATVWHL